MAGGSFGPQSANYVTSRPASDTVVTPLETFFKDCTSSTSADGTVVTASWLNMVTAQLRQAIKNAGIALDDSDDSQLWKAMQSATKKTASATPPVGPRLGDFWFDTINEVLFIFINDGNSNLWLDISTVGGGGAYVASASQAEVNAGVRSDVFVSPATLKSGKISGVFARSPSGGFPSGTYTVIPWGSGTPSGTVGEDSTWNGTYLTMGVKDSAKVWLATINLCPNQPAGTRGAVMIYNDIKGLISGIDVTTPDSSPTLSASGVFKAAAGERIYARYYQQTGSAKSLDNYSTDSLTIVNLGTL